MSRRRQNRRVLEASLGSAKRTGVGFRMRWRCFVCFVRVIHDDGWAALELGDAPVACLGRGMWCVADRALRRRAVALGEGATL